VKLSVARYVDGCDRNRYRIIAAWALLLAGGVLLARHLDLRTSFAELLPNDDPGVVALNQTQKRMGDMSLLLVGIRSPDHQANLRYAQTLTDQLNHLPKEVCEMAAYHVRDLRDFFERNKWLYLSEPDLEDIHDTIRREISRRKNPLFVDLSDDDGTEALKKRIASRDKLGGRFRDGYFSRAGDQTVWIAALPPGGLFVENAGEALFKATARLIRENPPERFHPQMRAHIGGPVTTAIENRRAVERDILWVTIVCVGLVALSIAIYYRRLRAVPLVTVSATIGAVLAFALAELAFGYLNSSTAFLGSIIVGNGINYAIMLVARYEEEAGKHPTARDALVHAVRGVWRNTLVSSFVASASYASLVVTSFRGFYQFGVMGGFGCLASWAVTFTLVPAILFVLDRRTMHTKTRRGPIRLQPIAWLVERRARLIVGVSAVLTIAAVIGCGHFLHDPFEYNFRKLNTKIGRTDEAKSFERDMESLFGRWPSPTIVLADRVEDVEPIRRALRRQDDQAPGPDVIGQIVTIYDLLPGTPEAQQRKLDLIAKIRKLAQDPAIEALSEKEKADIKAATPPDYLRVLKPVDLPPLARRPFTEVDGSIGRVVLFYPIETGLSVWNGRDLLRIAAVVQQLKLEDGKTVETSGSAVIFGSMIRSVLHDGPIATGASICAVILIIFIALRPWRWAVLAACALAIGVTWMVGTAGWAGVRVTFLNFIALPITFGIGVEYAVNVTARFRERYDVGDAISSTGGTVAMCSWTTIVGYGSLLAAQNQALQGFGAMAILGEIACLLAAVVALPALLTLLRIRGRNSQAMPAVTE
jgi:predicted RND superfamily exporter protein